MTAFLITAGLTGSLLAFYEELDALLIPGAGSVHAPSPQAPMLDMVTLLERAYEQRPDIISDSALAPYRRDAPLELWVEAREPNNLPVDGQLFLDPYTGDILASRRWGDISQGLINLMPFLYKIHYSLALGEIGTLAFGIIALLWSLDCFVGAYLTLPRGHPFLTKWKIAWGINRKRLNYDLHRAFGLWTWLLLFVFAWSSVALNLETVYYPITDFLFGFAEQEEHHHRDKDASTFPPQPAMGWRAGYQRGRELMRDAVIAHHIDHYREDALRYDQHTGKLTFWIATKFKNRQKAYDWFGVTFNASTGELLEINGEDVEPDKERAGDFVTRWLIDLHFADVWGLPYRILVCCMGLVVVMLSVTGVVIWWRKRRPRRLKKRRS